MGRTIYRYCSVRLPRFKSGLGTVVLLSITFGPLFLFINSCSQQKINTPVIEEAERIRPLVSVAALGRLIPSGDIRKLAAPTSGFGGTPRIEQLLVVEGQKIKKGDILAIFDNHLQIVSDIDRLKADLEVQIDNFKLQESLLIRYKIATQNGAFPLNQLDIESNKLIKYNGKINQLQAEIRSLKEELNDSRLISPLDGTVLKILAREGERSGVNGVMEVGQNQSMEALIEVYESDINRIFVGQRVDLVSENGGFLETINGEVSRISPQVGQRDVLATDPTGDADARVVEVRVKLEPQFSKLVSNLVGIKVIARFL